MVYARSGKLGSIGGAAELAIGRDPVTVVGAGIFGLACAWACAGRGRAVRVLEAARVGAGASGGPVGALSPHVPDRWNAKKQFQLEALREAAEFWAEIEAVSGVSPGFARRGRLLPLATPGARDLAEARSADAGARWKGAGTWQVEARWDTAWLAGDAAPCGVVRETLSAQLFPRQAVTALAAACRARGVEIREGARVTDLRVIDGQVIVAAGVPGFDLLPGGWAPGAGVKGQAAVLEVSGFSGAPMIYCDGVYVVSHGEGRVSVGSTSETDYADPTTTDHRLDALLERACDLCPALRGAPVVERWAGLRPRAPRRDPMLGAVPGHARVFAALGGFKIGFGIAPKAGAALAALLEGEDPELPESFSVAYHQKGVAHA